MFFLFCSTVLHTSFFPDFDDDIESSHLSNDLHITKGAANPSAPRAAPATHGAIPRRHPQPPPPPPIPLPAAAVGGRRPARGGGRAFQPLSSHLLLSRLFSPLFSHARRHVSGDGGQIRGGLGPARGGASARSSRSDLSGGSGPVCGGAATTPAGGLRPVVARARGPAARRPGSGSRRCWRAVLARQPDFGDSSPVCGGVAATPAGGL